MFRFNDHSLTLLVALILGFAWDQLFYGRVLGLSVLLFVGLTIAALFGLGWRLGVRPISRNLWLLLPLLFCAAMVFVRANSYVTFLNVVACLGLLGLLAHFYAAGQVERLGLLGYPLVLLQVGANTLVRPGPVVSASLDLKMVQTHSRRNLLPVLRGLLLALPVLLVFTCLLASADLVFAGYIEEVLHLKFLADLLEWSWRGAIIVVIAWILAGGLVYGLSRSPVVEESGLVAKVSRWVWPFSLGFIEAAILLVLVDVLFLIFVGIQLAYLFGGETNISGAGYTYAEYARRGFFELVAVSVLTLGLILVLQQWVRCQMAWQTVTFKGLSSLLIALVLVILASAFQRLLLYEMAYGYTELRLYSHIFMVWLAATFGWFLLTLWLRPERFAVGAFAAALGFIVTLNLINPDAFIARQNLTHLDDFIGPQSQSYARDNELDVDYLTTLSDDAVPALIAGLEQVNPAERVILAAHLRARREWLAEELQAQPWPSFHLAQQQAYALLVEME
jgi:hypothetical protein